MKRYILELDEKEYTYVSRFYKPGLGLVPKKCWPTLKDAMFDMKMSLGIGFAASVIMLFLNDIYSIVAGVICICAIAYFALHPKHNVWKSVTFAIHLREKILNPKIVEDSLSTSRQAKRSKDQE